VILVTFQLLYAQCGLTRDFYSEELNELRLPESAREFGQVHATHVEVRGICRACADGSTCSNSLKTKEK